MRFAGRTFRAGKHWAIEIPDLGIYTQGSSKRDAYRMAEEALEIRVNTDHFRAKVHPGKGEYLEISGNDTAALVSLMLRQRRSDSGLSLAEVSQRLGNKSRNAYARYEQGLSVPTIEKLAELLLAIDPKHDLLLGPAKVV